MISSPNRDNLVFPKVRVHAFWPSYWTQINQIVLNCILWTVLIVHRSLIQGGWEDDESVTEAACREALEEAGVKGILRVSSSTSLVVGIIVFLLYVNHQCRRGI